MILVIDVDISGRHSEAKIAMWPSYLAEILIGQIKIIKLCIIVKLYSGYVTANL